MFDYKDLIVSGSTTVLTCENVATARINGLGAEMMCVPARGLPFNANLRLLDFKYEQHLSSVGGVLTDVSDISPRTAMPEVTISPSAQYGTTPINIPTGRLISTRAIAVPSSSSGCRSLIRVWIPLRAGRRTES